MVGQENLRESLLIGLLTGGHILMESVPGLAKTTAARVIAESIHGGFQRIQCTPDLLPSDIIGTQVYEAATTSFVTQLGPVHTNIVLLDEINRSSAKTQSAMLEAMEERQTTIAGKVYPIPEPFLVIATQNPVDQEGTYPLSEAQTDRFMLKEILRTPLGAGGRGDLPDRRRSVRPEPPQPAGRQPRRHSPAAGRRAQRAHGPGADALRQRAGRRDPHPEQFLPRQLGRLIEYGASPRATIAFCQAARALAVLSGRNHVIPDDIAKLAHRVLRHRLILGFEAASASVTPDIVIDAVLQAVRVP